MSTPEHDARAAARAGTLPEETGAGSADPAAQAEAVLEDSDARAEDRDASPGTVVEHRRSETIADQP